MTDRPILFSGLMIRALLDGRKTQTRRALKPQPELFPVDDAGTLCDVGLEQFEDDPLPRIRLGRCITLQTVPYAPGDRLWVRETFAVEPDGMGAVRVVYAAGGMDADLDFSGDAKRIAQADRLWTDPERNRPSIHMPRWASRLTLIVADVRVQRLQDIGEADARAEGATQRLECHGFRDMYPGWSMDWSKVGEHSDYATGGPGPLQERDISLGDACMAFASYWNEINGPGAWEANPWVVALTFTVHRCNIDQMGAA